MIFLKIFCLVSLAMANGFPKGEKYSEEGLLHRNPRAYGQTQWFSHDNDDSYNVPDYAGNDRKGSDVGYQDAHDDFPTVVW